MTGPVVEIANLRRYLLANYPEAKGATVSAKAIDAFEQLSIELGRLRTFGPDPKAGTPQLGFFAIVRDRHFDGSGLQIAVFDGVNYTFSDGDCFERDGDTLDGYTAEFLTLYQLEKRLSS